MMSQHIPPECLLKCKSQYIRFRAGLRSTIPNPTHHLERDHPPFFPRAEDVEKVLQPFLRCEAEDSDDKDTEVMEAYEELYHNWVKLVQKAKFLTKENERLSYENDEFKGSISHLEVLLTTKDEELGNVKSKLDTSLQSLKKMSTGNTSAQFKTTVFVKSKEACETPSKNLPKKNRNAASVCWSSVGPVLVSPSNTSTNTSRKFKSYFDSGCSRHMTGTREYLMDFETYNGGKVIYGGGYHGQIIGKGTLNVEGVPKLHNVLLVDGLMTNLIIISQLCDSNMNVEFDKQTCKVFDDSNVCFLTGTRMEDNCYLVCKDGVALVKRMSTFTKDRGQKLISNSTRSLHKISQNSTFLKTRESSNSLIEDFNPKTPESLKYRACSNHYCRKWFSRRLINGGSEKTAVKYVLTAENRCKNKRPADFPLRFTNNRRRMLEFLRWLFVNRHRIQFPDYGARDDDNFESPVRISYPPQSFKGSTVDPRPNSYPSPGRWSLLQMRRLRIFLPNDDWPRGYCEGKRKIIMSVSHRDVKKKSQMVEFGVVPNVYTYNALIHAQIRNGNIDKAHYLKREMLLVGVLPDLVTYNLLIGAACDLGDISFELQMYDEMLRRGCKPGIISYTELLKCYCMRSEMEKAEELFSNIRMSDLEIDHVPFIILMKKYFKIGELDKVFDLHLIWLRGGN
ncbi:pentatricopeptide repeat-containing protein at5g24830 [Phtheirospermum japonicum]|uniref:Pentatricopeptide repeat-containing protein at5g24830 n=1 Tax=Phtheirospermum japonicum TaxID=374723 RepID=A0A830AXP2_9LAMI|nr:pentatricopeptide repeat-containing protein at5g24830 [Phtheirospermum japonicum]